MLLTRKSDSGVRSRFAAVQHRLERVFGDKTDLAAMFALGGRAFTKSLADRLDLPFPRAEAVKVEIGFAPRVESGAGVVL